LYPTNCRKYSILSRKWRGSSRFKSIHCYFSIHVIRYQEVGGWCFSRRIYSWPANPKVPPSSWPISVWQLRFKVIRRLGLVSCHVFISCLKHQHRALSKIRFQTWFNVQFSIIATKNCNSHQNTTRFRRHAGIFVAWGAQKRALRQGGGFMGLWRHTVHFTGGLPAILGRGPAATVCPNKIWRLRRIFPCFFPLLLII